MAEELANRLELREEWFVYIDEMAKREGENSVAKAVVNLRVARKVLEMRRESYIPQFISLGPLYRQELEKDFDTSFVGGKISTVEALKGKSVTRISKKLPISCHGQMNFGDLVEKIEGKLPEIESFYDCPQGSISTNGDYSKKFALMMTVDSSFLLLFLYTAVVFHDRSHRDSLSDEDRESFDDDSIDLYFRHSDDSIQNDIVKLANQILLVVLGELFENVKGKLKVAAGKTENPFHGLLQKTCKVFSPFRTPEKDDNNPKSIENEAQSANKCDDQPAIEYDDQPHLLGCMHAFVSPLLKIDVVGENPSTTWWEKLKDKLSEVAVKIVRLCFPTIPEFERGFLNGISAVHLDRAGIKFKSFNREPPYKIRFDKHTGTIYLPKIMISEKGTEVLLRNMIALETNDATRPNAVKHYVALMHHLIQSPDDVRLLKDHGVIYRGYCPLTDELIVKMWNDMNQPFFSDSVINVSGVKLARALREVLWENYYKSKIKRTLWGIFYYVSSWKSWKFMAPLSVFLGLVMTAIQTYCSVDHC